MNDGTYAERTGAASVRIERLLPGPIERVWAYLTEPERRATWLAGGSMELAVGGRVELLFRNCGLTGHDEQPPAKYADLAGEVAMHGRITAIESPTLLAYTWGEGDAGESEVRFTLAREGDRVRLIVEHRRLTRRDLMISVAGGWHAHLDILADRLAGRAPPPFWSTHARLEGEYEKRIADSD